MHAAWHRHDFPMHAAEMQDTQSWSINRPVMACEQLQSIVSHSPAWAAHGSACSAAPPAALWQRFSSRQRRAVARSGRKGQVQRPREPENAAHQVCIQYCTIPEVSGSSKRRHEAARVQSVDKYTFKVKMYVTFVFRIFTSIGECTG